jgi:hypothetical protein
MPPTSLLTSSDRGASGCWREKASRRAVSWAARLAPSRALSMQASALAVGRQPALGQVQRADDDGQHVVEVVGDAAGELADGLHLLELAHLGLGRLAALGLGLQAGVGARERVAGLQATAQPPAARR